MYNTHKKINYINIYIYTLVQNIKVSLLYNKNMNEIFPYK